MLYFIRMLFYTNIRKRDVKDEFYQVKNSKEIDILKASKVKKGLVHVIRIGALYPVVS